MSRIACIGSRETPPAVLRWMESAGAELVRTGHTVVSGNAPGADQAWARGGNSVDPAKVELCLPWAYFESSAIVTGNVLRQLVLDKFVDAWKLAQQLHPRWDRCSDGARRLLTRNVMIVQGSDRVLGYLNRGKKGGGGTGFAFKIARHLDVKAYDVSEPEIREAFDGASINGPIFP